MTENDLKRLKGPFAYDYELKFCLIYFFATFPFYEK